MGMAALIIAACFILVVIGGGIGIGHRQANSVASVIMLDVNPSIELKVNQEERVLEALPLNDDAQAILNGMDLKNTQLEDVYKRQPFRLAGRRFFAFPSPTPPKLLTWLGKNKTL